MALFFVTGDLNLDTTTIAPVPPAMGKEAPARIMTSFGGQGGNVAYFLRCLGQSVCLFGALGNDPMGSLYEAHLAQLGIQFAGIHAPVPTGMVSVVQEGDLYHMYRQRGANGSATAMTFAGFLHRAAAAPSSGIFLSGYSLLNDGCCEALSSFASRSAVIALDPASIDAMKALGRRQVLATARRCTYLLPNEEEACWLAETENAHAAADTLYDLTGRTVVVKLGPRGALLRNGDDTLELPALPVAALDVTGAGDAFAAAFLAAKAGNGSDEAALREAIRFSGTKIQFAGTQPPECLPEDAGPQGA